MDDFEDAVELEPPSDRCDNLWFVADVPLDNNIKKQIIANCSGVREFEESLFTNRSPETLLSEFDIEHIWCNVRKPKALQYVQKYIKPNIEAKSRYEVIVVHRSTKNMKHQKWVQQLQAIDGAVTATLRHSDLSKIQSLNIGDLVDSIEQSLVLSAPATTLGAFLECSKSILAKKKRAV